MSESLLIRHLDAASARDTAAFRRLNVEWLERFFVVEPDDDIVLSHPVREIIEPGGVILLAEIADAIAGCVALIAQPGDAACWEMAKLAVTAGFQGQKIGRRLLEAIIVEARSLGARRVVLVTNSGLAPARRLYESLDFTYLPREAAGALAHYERGDTFMEKFLD
jgi:putative acetyltransferase